MAANGSENKKSRPMGQCMKRAREALAIIVWIYILVKVLVFDIDVYLFERYAPSLRSILDYKFFIIIGIVAPIWFTLGRGRSWSFIGYVAGYPLVILFWRIPKAALRRWPLLIALLPALYDLWKTFPSALLRYAVTAIAVLVIAISSNRIAILVSMLVLGVSLTIHLVRSFNRAYRSNVFTGLADLARKVRMDIESGAFSKSMEGNADVAESEQAVIEVRQRDVEAQFFVNWVSLFLAEKVHSVLRSRRLDMCLIASWFYTVAVAIVAFAFEYWGLHKISVSAFSGAENASLWSFLQFSADVFAPSRISQVTPITLTSQLLYYLEVSSAVAIGVILFFIVLTAAREAYKKDMEDFIEELRLTGKAVEQRLSEVHNVSLQQIEIRLAERSPQFVNRLRKARGLPELAIVEKGVDDGDTGPYTDHSDDSDVGNGESRDVQ